MADTGASLVEDSERGVMTGVVDSTGDDADSTTAGLSGADIGLRV